MHIETENFIIDSDKQLPYIEEVLEYLNEQIPGILSFFELNSLSKKKRIVIWNDINEYRKHVEQFTEYKEWMCADTFDGNINMLSVEECQKTESHKYEGVGHFKTTIAHEFVHICHQEVQQSNGEEKDAWYWEALATNLGNPENFSIREVNVSSDELIYGFNDIKYGYPIAYTIGRYMLDNYPHEKILFYIKNPKSIIEDTPTIIEEVKEYLRSIKKI